MPCTDVTLEELAQYADGELRSSRLREVEAHVAGCEDCRSRLASVQEADGMLSRVRPSGPPDSVKLAARRKISEAARPASTPQVLALNEVAALLHITMEELDEIAGELPAFEVAGRIRVRRAKLLAWIAAREQEYVHRTAASWASESKAESLQKGVA